MATEDQRLVWRFLEAHEGLSGPEIERRVPGVTQSDVSRWRLGDWSYLTERKREAVSAALKRGVILPDHYKKRLRDALTTARGLVSTLETMAAEAGAEGAAALRSEGWVTYLAELVEMGDMGKDGEDELYGARVAATAFDELDARDRVRPADRLQWEAFKAGRSSIPWDDLEPVDELPMGTDMFSDISPEELVKRYQDGASKSA